MRVTCWPRCCPMVRSEGDLCVTSSTTSSDHKLWLVKRTSHLCKVNVRLWFFHILSGVFSLWLKQEHTVFYVICNVDVGRAKGNLWQPNHKRWFYVWREWYWNEASSDHLQASWPQRNPGVYLTGVMKYGRGFIWCTIWPTVPVRHASYSGGQHILHTFPALFQSFYHHPTWSKKWLS